MITILLLLMATMLFTGCGDQKQRQFRQEKRQFAIVMDTKVKQFAKRTSQLSAGMTEGDSLAVEVDSLKHGQGELLSQIKDIDDVEYSDWKRIRPDMESRYYDLERRYYEIASAASAREAAAASTDSLEVIDSSDTAQARPSLVTPASAASPDSSAVMLQGN